MLVVSKATIIVYQPQPESFEGDRISGRAVVSVTPDGQSEPVYGTIWMSARVETDRDERMVYVVDLDVTRVRFPEATPEQAEELGKVIERDLPRFGLSVSLDRLLTSLDLSEKEKFAASDLSSFPPLVVFADSPTVLVSIDGKPKMRQVEGTGLMRVVNSPFLIAFDTSSKSYYIDGGEVWYVAEDVMGPWQHIDDPPAAVVALRPDDPGDEQGPGEEAQGAGEEAQEAGAEAAGAAEGDGQDDEDEAIPAIRVATKPTELIVTDGPPRWDPVDGTGLQYMSNTESDVLKDMETRRMYVPLSGRWYFSNHLEGPWIFVPSDHLPADFANIPPDGELGHLLAFVSGTKEAEEAMLDHYVPQTVAINRDAADLTLSYDGDPQFEAIDGTGMAYAINTDVPVIRVSTRYYACHQAVWYVAANPQGPWAIAAEVPEEIYTIPGDSPVYNVTYVRVFDATDDLVYVGYYPGYLGSYLYGDTIVYGTGWDYDGWYDTYYYAWPRTWGFHARWNPWTGWSVGIGYRSGRFTYRVGRGGWYRGHAWGPTGYHGYSRGYGRSGYHGYGAGARPAARSATRPGAHAGARTARRQGNIYNRGGNRARNAPSTRSRTLRQSSPASNRPNNVYADRNGNVHRRTADGWQQRQGNQWQRGSPSAQRTRPAAQPRASANRQRELDRSHQARQRGEQRVQRQKQSRGAAPRARSRRR
jgi:hypothetical protein